MEELYVMMEHFLANIANLAIVVFEFIGVGIDVYKRQEKWMLLRQ